MNVLAEIREKLANYPHLRIAESQDSIEVERPSDDGFSVALYVDGGNLTVYFDSWHQHFESAEDALHCFAWGLSGECRLKVTYRGATPVSTTVEYLENGSWHSFGTTALLFRPFWRPRRVAYLQNPPLTAA